MFACSTSVKPDTLVSHCVQEQGECDRVRKDLANLDSESKDAQALISRLAEEQVRYIFSWSATGDVRPLVSLEYSEMLSNKSGLAFTCVCSDLAYSCICCKNTSKDAFHDYFGVICHLKCLVDSHDVL